MTPDQKFTAALAQLAMLACLLGLVRTGRWRMCVSFLGYVLAIVSLGPLQTWFPERFNTWPYWTFKETVYAVFKLALSVELASRICRWFPGARETTERWALGVLLATAGGIVFAPWSPDFLLDVTGELMARASIGTLWLLVATALAVRHYRLPVHPFQWGLLVGFGTYLAAFGFLMRLINVLGWHGYEYTTALVGPAYLSFAFWMAWISWRDDAEATEDYERTVGLVRSAREVTA